MIPTFKVVREADGNGLFFWCPYCKKDHRHGAGGNLKAHTTHRVAHCNEGPLRETGYNLMVPAAPPTEAQNAPR